METSYHFLSQRIDLHLCDDAGGKIKEYSYLFMFYGWIALVLKTCVKNC